MPRVLIHSSHLRAILRGHRRSSRPSGPLISQVTWRTLWSWKGSIQQVVGSVTMRVEGVGTRSTTPETEEEEEERRMHACTDGPNNVPLAFSVLNLTQRKDRDGARRTVERRKRKKVLPNRNSSTDACVRSDTYLWCLRRYDRDKRGALRTHTRERDKKRRRNRIFTCRYVQKCGHGEVADESASQSVCPEKPSLLRHLLSCCVI